MKNIHLLDMKEQIGRARDGTPTWFRELLN